MPRIQFCRARVAAADAADAGPVLGDWTEPPAAFPRADPGEVHLWLTPLGGAEADIEESLRLLSPEEAVRAGSFRFPADRGRFIVAHGWMRRVLAGYLGEAPERLVFRAGPQGKPGLTPFSAEAAALSFNLAHSDEMALLAVSAGRPIGADIERIKPIEEAEAIVARFYSPREQEHYWAAPPEARDVAFFQLWTRKEAVLKGIGSGLDETLDHLDTSPDRERASGVAHAAHQAIDTASWQLASFRVSPNHMGAIAVG